MRRVSAKFVPRFLIDDLKENRVEISQELLASANGNENFKNIITGDETWVYGYDVDTKVQSSQWLGKGSPRPRKARMSRSKIKVMLVVFFDWQGIVHHEFVRRGQMVNRQLYQEFLARLRYGMRRKRPELWVTRLGCCTTTMRRLTRRSSSAVIWQNIRCAPSTLSLDLAPVHFFLFPKHKTSLKGRCFQTIEEIQENVIRELRAITESAFREAFQQWNKCWEQCFASRGDYFEGDSA